MRLARFDDGSGPRPGVILGDRIADVLAADPSLPQDPGLWLGASRRCLGERLCARVEAAPKLPLADVTLLAPLERPGKILAVGLNYADHAREMGRTVPAIPACFMKPSSALAGPTADIPHPGFSDTLDYEGELAIVIGTGGRHLTGDAARAAIGGYTIANDVSLREFVKPDTLPLGKGLDGFLPLGPWITSADLVPDPQDLTIRTFVNGELRQDGRTGDMAHGVVALVELFSRFMRLEPGDVILTGSPRGSATAFDPPRFLQPGDVVEVELTGLGAIRNRVAD